jgi:Zn-dependent peptidase ImmA (M78 family)/transcriptional regulator with XRE-family HTH domain
MVNGERLRQARELCGFTKTQLADLVHVERRLVTQIEDGKTQPPERIVEAITLATGFPPAFFKQQLNGAHFWRYSLLFPASAGVGKLQHAQAHRYGEVLYEAVEKMTKRFKTLPVRLPKVVRSPTVAARMTRRTLGLSPTHPIPNVIDVLEQGGLLILALPFMLKGRDGFSCWAGFEETKPVIALSGGRPGDRMRFSMAHELGHLVMHRGWLAEPWKLEAQANCFAAEFLMPEAGIRCDLVPPVTLTSLAKLTPKWGVSLQTLIRRAKDLGIVRLREYRSLVEQLGARGWGRQESSHLTLAVEKPRAFIKMAEALYGRPIDVKKFSGAMLLGPTFLRKALAAHEALGVDVTHKSIRSGTGLKLIR